MTSPTMSAADFLASAPAAPNGSSPWASRYSAELKRVIHDHAARAPRTLQQHLGPSEIGVACDRAVVFKMAAFPATNHVVDPWPSIVGTALHAWEADACDGDNERTGVLRWITEQKVTPHPDHPGTADLYDAVELAVVDWKNLGPSTLDKIRKGGPVSPLTGKPTIGPRHYRVQLFLYGLGYVLLGLPVKRVVIAAMPRTAGSLDGMFVRDEDFTSDGFTLLPEPKALLDEVFEDTARRRKQAQALLDHTATLQDIPAEPSEENCWFCSAYRPEAARKPELLMTSCPGPRKGGAS